MTEEHDGYPRDFGQQEHVGHSAVIEATFWLAVVVALAIAVRLAL